MAIGRTGCCEAAKQPEADTGLADIVCDADDGVPTYCHRWLTLAGVGVCGHGHLHALRSRQVVPTTDYDVISAVSSRTVRSTFSDALSACSAVMSRV
jgi:hypothetical protein